MENETGGNCGSSVAICCQEWSRKRAVRKNEIDWIDICKINSKLMLKKEGYES